MRAILLKVSDRDHQEQLFERWTLPAKGQYDEKQMISLTYFDLNEGRLDRVSLTAKEFDELKLTDQDGNEIPVNEYGSLYSDLKSDTILVLEFVISGVKKGRITIDALTEIKVIDKIGINW